MNKFLQSSNISEQNYYLKIIIFYHLANQLELYLYIYNLGYISCSFIFFIF